MSSARGLPLPASSFMPISVCSKSSAVKCASASSRLAACAAGMPSAELKTNKRMTRQARQKRIAGFPGLDAEGGTAAFRHFMLQRPERDYEPPHLLVTVFQLPHLCVTQSPMRSFEVAI